MTPFKNPPPIEELGDIAWKRVEHGLMARLDTLVPEAPVLVQRSRTPWMVGSLALAAAAAIALFVVGSGTSLSTKAPALVHAQISELMTQESKTQLELIGANVEVAAHSAISVEQGDNRLRIDLRSGSVRLKVAKRDDMREPVAVVAGDVRVEVMGTEFAVYREDNSARVEVYEGVVRVTSKGERSLVHAGEVWPTEVASNEVVRNKRAKHKARAHRAEDHASPPAPSDSARELFDEAQALEVSDPAQALKLYAQAAEGKGAWAANALFAQARLTLSQGQTAVAKKLLNRYAKHYPEGANIADVMSLLED